MNIHSTLTGLTGTQDTGRQVFGELDSSLYTGELTVAPIVETVFQAYTTNADVFLNGKLIYPNETMYMDTGTNNIQAYVLY